MEKGLVLVVGPHRSGTSVTAAALGVLSAELGLSEIYANPENPKGFFEHPGAVDMNDELLAELGATWDTPSFDARAALAEGALSPERRDHWVGQIAWLIGHIRGGSPIVAVKDPRICLTAPIWIEAAARAGIEPGNLRFVYVHRDPVEVAVSQRTRAARSTAVYEFGRALPEGAALWLAYTGQIFEATAGHQVTVVAHQALMEEPVASVTRLAEALGLPADPERIGAFASEFVSGELYRSRTTPADREEIRAALPSVPEIAALLDATATAPAAPEDLGRRIGALWRAPETQAALARAVLPVLGRLNRKARLSAMEAADLAARLEERVKAAEALEAELAKQVAAYERASTEKDAAIKALQEEQVEICAAYEQNIAELKAEIAKLLSSASWRVTAPLRAILGTLR